MPFPNEHSARLRNPDDFDPKSFRRTAGGRLFGGRIEVPQSVGIVWAKLKGKAEASDPPMPQALRFKKSSWTAEAAKKWLDRNGIHPASFEPAAMTAAELQLSSLSLFDLTGLHSRIHKEFSAAVPNDVIFTGIPESDVRRHDEVVMEFFRRGIIHVHSDFLDDQAQVEAPDDDEYLFTSIWKSPGGKSRLSRILSAFIPPHRTYCECFAGGAAVFFAKKPSEVEVLNDANPEIASSFAFVKAHGEEDRRALISMPWENTGEYFSRMLQSKPSTTRDRFYRFLYLKKFSFGGRSMNWTATAYTTDLAKRWIDKRLPEAADRLKNVSIHNEDFESVVKKYDAPDTFFYFDPPYKEQRSKTLEVGGNFDHDRLAKVCGEIKGKFMLSYDDIESHRQNYGKFKIHPIGVPSVMDRKHSLGAVRKELLIANFEISGQVPDRIAASEFECQAWA